MTAIGYSDLPTSQDTLNIKSYSQSLKKFISNCKTPMTISIQGEWGTGKSSMMKVLHSSLDDKEVRKVWIDTWQFSQFTNEEQMLYSLFNHFIDKLNEGKLNQNESYKKVKETFISAISSSLSLVLPGIAGGVVKDMDFKSFFSQDKSLVNLKDDFKKNVEEICSKEYSRVAVFIDDIDRLPPNKAVELLEVLKNFFDVENVVYILAVDNAVVYSGLEAKYGTGLEEDKLESFFDKLIQVPFKLPVSRFDVKSLVRDLVKDNMFSKLDFIESVIVDSVGKNPRSIKRLLNVYTMLCMVVEEESNRSLSDDESDVLLLIIAIQMKYKELYEYFEEVSIDDVQKNVEISVDNFTDVNEIRYSIIKSFYDKYLNEIFKDSGKTSIFKTMFEVSDITNTKTNKKSDSDKEMAQIHKVRSKLPRWLKKKTGYGYRFMNAYIVLWKEDKEITVELLFKKFLDLYPDTTPSRMKANFAQLKDYGEKNHGKLFEVENNRVTIWSKVSEILNGYEIELKEIWNIDEPIN